MGKYGERFKKPLHFAARKGHRNTVIVLLNAGVDISATTCHKGTAPHYAAIGKHEDVGQLLWEAGINASRKGLLWDDNVRLRVLIHD